MSKRVLVLVEAVLALGLLAGAAWQRHELGLESGFLSLAPLLLVPHLRRLLAILGRAPAPSWLGVALELGVLAGLARYPAPLSSIVLATLAALVHAAPSAQEEKPVPRALDAGVLLVQGLAALVLATALRRGEPLALHRAVLYLPVLVEALSPRRDRSTVSSLRRLAAALVVSATHVSGLVPVVFPALWVGGIALVHLSVHRVPAGDRARTKRRRILRLVALGIALAIFALTGEALFRLIPNRYRDCHVPPPNTHWHEPGQLSIYEGSLYGIRQPRNVITWNKGGWNDVDHELAKPADTARIVVLGDSYVEAVQVPFETIYHRKVERALAARSAPTRVEAISISASGWGQGQELAALREHGLAFAPDLVIVEFLCANDVRNNLDELEARANEEGLRSTPARALYYRCLDVGLFFHAFVCDKLDQSLRRIIGRTDPVDGEVYRPRPRVAPDLWERAWKRTEELFRDLKQTCARAGADLVVVSFTAPHEIAACLPGAPPPAPDAFDFRFPDRKVEEICRANGIPFLALSPRFAKLSPEERERIHIVGDGHWTSEGHAHAVDETVRFLVDETGLWPRLLERVRQGSRR